MKGKEIKEFVNQFKQKDSETIRAFYRLNYPKARHFVYQNSGSEEQCKDVYQDAFIALWEKIDSVEFDSIDAVNGYFYRMVQFKWYDQLRKQKRELNHQPEWQEWHDEIDWEKEEKINLLENQFAKLGETCRKVLRLFYYQEQSYEHMAQEMEYTADVLKTMKYRCLKKLKKQMKQRVEL